MKKATILVVLALLFIVVQAVAQEKEDKFYQARVDIARATLEFLTHDKGAFKNVKTNTCKNCSTFEDLTRFVDDNKLTGAEKIIKECKEFKIDEQNPAISLEKLTNKMVSTITQGERRQGRKEFAEFSTYKEGLKAIQASYVEEPEPIGEEGENAANFVSEDSVQQVNVEEEGQATKDEGYLSYLLYGLVAVMAVALISIFAQNQQLSKKLQLAQKRAAKPKEPGETLEERELRHYKDLLHEVREENKQLKQQLELAKQKEVNSGSSPMQTFVQQEETRPADIPQPNSRSVKAEHTKKYARYADQGDGFTISELLNEEDDETIFEITSTSNTTAHFSISRNTNAQRYALMNASYYLSRTCEYSNSPTVSSKIKTEEPGELKLQGNKWQITHPIKISFV